MKKTLLSIDVEKCTYTVDSIDEADVIGVVDYALSVLDPLNPDCVVIGVGPFAGSRLPGVNRVTIAGNSPLTGGFHITSIGGAGYLFSKTGVDFVKIEGKPNADDYMVPVIKNIDGRLDVEFYTIQKDTLRDIHLGDGLYSLESHLLERYRDAFRVGGEYIDMRMLVAGPASLNTRMGALVSTLIKKGKFVPNADCWAGRGGMGSLLAHNHKIVGIVYGGNHVREFPVDLNDRTVINKMFQKLSGESMLEVAKDATKKYKRGTLASNYASAGKKLPMFDFDYTIPSEKREYLYELLEDNFLEPFEKKVVSRTCGEPSCPTPCKKIYEESKMDYESSNALGPNSGVFRIEEIKQLLQRADVCGFDSIEFGNMTSAVLGWVHAGLLNKKDVGIDLPINFDPDTYKLQDSTLNSDFCMKLIDDVAYGRTEFARILGKGIRYACKHLEEVYGNSGKGKFSDFAHYAPFGEGDGCIAQIRYRVLGAIIVPGVIPGKFHTDYSDTPYLPEELGKKSANRGVWEIVPENLGFCRFHRKWYEKYIENIFNDVFGEEINIYNHHRKLLQKVIAYNKKAGDVLAPLEAKRSIDAVKSYVMESDSADLVKWADKMRHEGDKAVEEYCEQAQQSFNNAFTD